MKFKAVFLGFLLVTLVVAPSCNQKNQNNKKVATLKADKLDIKKVKEEIVEIIVSLPDSYETVNLINETGASFIGGLTQEGMSTAELLTRADKAKAYGYLMFDMAYANIYNQSASFSNLLELHQKLTQDLGYEALLKSQKSYQKRYMDNRDNRDSVDQIVSEMLNETNNYIQDNGSASDISLVFAGVTAKSLYVMSSLTLFAMNNEQLIDLLKEQKGRVEAAINILGMVPDDQEVVKMAEALTPVTKVYGTGEFNIESVEQIQQATKPLFE